MGEILKDSHGRKIGEIRAEGSRQAIYDAYGRRLGYYDGRYTFDAYGRRIGSGNLLASLLHF